MTNSSKSRGFTLVEIMAVTVMLTVFTGAAASLSAHLFGSDRLAEAYTNDVLECQRVLDMMRRDVRAATTVEASRNVLWLSSPEQEVVYRLEDGALSRTESGEHRVVARGLASFRAESEGTTVHVRLELGTRVAHKSRRPAALTTTMGTRARSRR